VVGVSRHTIRVDDDELDAFLDETENKSETVREALRLYRLERGSVEDERLTDNQRQAYEWLRKNVGFGGGMELQEVKPMLAQILSIDKAVVKRFVIRPLDRFGYVEVDNWMDGVRIYVRPPDAVEGTANAVDRPEGASETLDTLAAAGEEVSQSAD